MGGNSDITPLFLFSLPRSGSTLLQRILTVNDAVATVSEPWVLLPYVYTLRREQVFADYDHFVAVRAIQDLYDRFPNGKQDYLQEIANFTRRLYAKAVLHSECRYFLDKTPRYHLIIDEIIQMFPDAKFIFLWRNPLAVVASMMQTWAEGKWNLYKLNIDLFEGVVNLTTAYEKYTNRVCGVRYEDIITVPAVELERVFDYLDIPFNSDSLSDFSKVKFEGHFGDSKGIKQYQSISQAPLDKWQGILNNPIRRFWCRRYLRWMGQERLAVMGYDLDALLTVLETMPLNLRFIGSDIVDMVYGSMCRIFEPRILKRKLQNANSWHEINLHT